MRARDRTIAKDWTEQRGRRSLIYFHPNNLFVRRLEGRGGVQIQDAITLAGIRSEPELDIVVNSSPDFESYAPKSRVRCW